MKVSKAAAASEYNKQESTGTTSSDIVVSEHEESQYEEINMDDEIPTNDEYNRLKFKRSVKTNQATYNHTEMDVYNHTSVIPKTVNSTQYNDSHYLLSPKEGSTDDTTLNSVSKSKYRTKSHSNVKKSEKKPELQQGNTAQDQHHNDHDIYVNTS